jgi:hypothetical protein
MVGMNHTGKKAIIAIAAVALALTPGSANADHRDDANTYVNDSYCFVSDANGNPLALSHYWEFTAGFEQTAHSGTSSMTVVPCVPTVCPEGYWMASGWLCSTVEPWASSPEREDSPQARVLQAAVALEQAAINGPDVGPLLPFAPMPLTDTTT